MFKIEDYQIDYNKVCINTIPIGSYFIPTSKGANYFSPFRLKNSKVGLQLEATNVQSGGTTYFNWLDKVVQLIPRHKAPKVTIEDCFCTSFAQKWNHSKRVDEHRYLSPLSIIYQIGEPQKHTEGTHDDFIDTLPVWEGDLTEVLSFMLTIGQIEDFTDNEQGGFVWTAPQSEVEFSHTAQTWRDTESGRGMMTFQQFFEDWMTNEDWELFIKRWVIPHFEVPEWFEVDTLVCFHANTNISLGAIEEIDGQFCIVNGVKYHASRVVPF